MPSIFLRVKNQNKKEIGMIVDFIPEDKKELDVYKHLSNSAELLNYVTLNKLDEASLKFLMEKIIIPKIDAGFMFYFDKCIENETSLYFFKAAQVDEESAIAIFDSVYYLQKNGRGFKINLPKGFLESMTRNFNILEK